MAVKLDGHFCVIGSHALRIQYPEFSRESKHPDLDLVCSAQDFEKNLSKFRIWSSISKNKVIAYVGNQRLELLIDEEYPLLKRNNFDINYCLQNIQFENLYIPRANELFSLKKSHIHYPIHWEKTIFDYHFLMSKCKDWEADFDAIELFNYERQKVKQRSAVVFKNKTKQEFFAQKPVDRMFDHDLLHDFVKKTESPMYKKILKHGQEVECDKKLFEALSRKEQLFCVIEEAEVLALERCLIPWITAGTDTKIEDPSQKAYQWALMRLCTDIAGGWFRDFCVDNYFKIFICETDLYNISLKLLNKEKSE